jgi:hypothetical protein
MPTKRFGRSYTVDGQTIAKLERLAEEDSQSLSAVVRRLIAEEYRRRYGDNDKGPKQKTQ